MRVLRWQSKLSLRSAHRIGGLLGWLMRVLPNRSRRVTQRNLELCFPDWSPVQRSRLQRQSLGQLGRGLMEAGALWCWPVERLLDTVVEIRGEEHFRQALGSNTSAMLLAPHLGAWEVLVHWCLQHTRGAVLYRPPRNPALAEWITRARERSGGELVKADMSGVRRLIKLARKGTPVGILPDQQPKQGEGEFASFFGVPALTMVLAARIAARTHPYVMTGWAERLPRGAGFRLHFAPLEKPMDSGDLEQDLAAMNRAVEQLVRGCPEQYQWNYKRFSIQPDSGLSPYD